MAHDIAIKQQTIRLRKAGYSIKEIAKKLTIAISTSSEWLRNVKISPAGINRMQSRQEFKRYKMSLKWVEKRETQYRLNLENAKNLLQTIKLICGISGEATRWKKRNLEPAYTYMNTTAQEEG